MRPGAAAGSRPRPSGSTPPAARSRGSIRGARRSTRRRPTSSTASVRCRSASYPAGASWVGALDMSGNAMEWVADWLDPTYYATSPAERPDRARRPARSRSRRAAGGGATSSSRGRPTGTTRIRRPTRTTTSASGSSRRDRPDRRRDGRRRVLRWSPTTRSSTTRSSTSPGRAAVGVGRASASSRPRAATAPPTSPSSTPPSPGAPRRPSRAVQPDRGRHRGPAAPPGRHLRRWRQHREHAGRLARPRRRSGAPAGVGVGRRDGRAVGRVAVLVRDAGRPIRSGSGWRPVGRARPPARQPCTALRRRGDPTRPLPAADRRGRPARRLRGR